MRKLYLVGPSGSGKSVALATLAHWARTSGWLVRGHSPRLAASVMHQESGPCQPWTLDLHLMPRIEGWKRLRNEIWR